MQPHADERGDGIADRGEEGVPLIAGRQGGIIAQIERFRQPVGVLPTDAGRPP